MASKIWRDHLDREVPATYVPKIDKKKEKVALRYLKKAKYIHNKLEEFKAALLEDCDELYELMLEEAEIDENKRKGNYTVTSFDKSVKIEVNVQERIEFDDHINMAQKKINQFLEEKTKGVDHDLAVLVNDAFKTSNGRLDTKRILGLFKLQIKGKLWEEAMELVKKSINRNNSKRYVRIFEKDIEGEYQNIELNFSSI